MVSRFSYLGNLSLGYRYGFNGQEKSDEIKGEANSYTAEFWEYDPRIGRRWNIDPITKEYESPYASLGNNTIWLNDENGADTSKPKESLVAKLDDALGGVDKNEKKIDVLRAGIKNQAGEIAKNKNLQALASDGMLNATTAEEFKANLSLYSEYSRQVQEHTKSLTFLIGQLYNASLETHDIQNYHSFINKELALTSYATNAMLTVATFLPTGGMSTCLFVSTTEIRASLFGLRGGMGYLEELD
jgi:hypothetical protein